MSEANECRPLKAIIRRPPGRAGQDPLDGSALLLAFLAFLTALVLVPPLLTSHLPAAAASEPSAEAAPGEAAPGRGLGCGERLSAGPLDFGDDEGPVAGGDDDAGGISL